MSRVCEICGKRVHVGNSVSRRGLAKRLGGVGRKVTGRTKRKFKPNIQRIRIEENGNVRRVKICTRCLKNAKIKKPVKRQHKQEAAAE